MRTITDLLEFWATLNSLAYLYEIDLYDHNEYSTRFNEVVAEYEAIK